MIFPRSRDRTFCYFLVSLPYTYATYQIWFRLAKKILRRRMLTEDARPPTHTKSHMYDYCLFGVFRPTREFFYSFGDVTITGEGLQILTNARHLWPLSSEGSLACQTYCGASIYNGHLRGPITLTSLAERLAVELSLPVLNDLGMLWLVFNHSTSRLRCETLTHCANAVVSHV